MVFHHSGAIHLLDHMGHYYFNRDTSALFVAKDKIGRRGTLAATLFTVIFLMIIIVPTWLLTDSLIDGLHQLHTIYQQGELVVPPPGDRVNTWPAFAKPVADFWLAASVNLTQAFTKFAPQIKVAGGWILSIIGGTSIGVLQFIGSIIIAGIMLAYSREGGDMVIKIFVRLAGEKGAHFAEISKMTIRNVVKGILGVAIVQTGLATIGFFVAGVPLAGLWAFFCLVFAIIQVGVGPIVFPIAIYMYATSDVLTASLFLGWSILVTLSDNVLKPILLGKGAPVPMLVVLLGSLGGLVAGGFIGLLLGPLFLR